MTRLTGFSGFGWGACCLAFFCAVSARAADARVYSVDPETGAATMTVGGKPCWTYNPVSEEGKPYFHPLCVPGTGDVLTGFRPDDHKWHLGLWLSWKFINGVNFWEPDKNAERKVVSHTETCDDATKAFESKAALAYVAKGKEVLREERVTRVVTQENGNYTITFDSAFTACGGEVKLDCTPAGKDKGGIWASGGYAGLMLRFAPNPAGTYSIADAQGRADAKTCGNASAWIETAVTLPNGGAKVRITDHPENPRYPNTWFSRHQPDAHKNTGYNLIGTGLVFHEPLTIEDGKSMRLRYTVEVKGDGKF
ncbi:MAG: PmoA family protein [Kiritimatiellaeota bacterium]|nr:PmoA family protein [Kiritimatiellota bacterium]